VTWNAQNDSDEAVADGTYYLNISTQDDAGLISHMRSTLTSGNVTKDTTAPNYVFVEANYTNTSGWSKSNESVTIQFTVNDTTYNNSDVKVSIVNVTNTSYQFANSTAQMTLSLDGSTITAVWNSTYVDADNENLEMADATYAVVVNSSDWAGNTGGTILTSAQTVIDNTAPSVTSVTFDDGSEARVAVTGQTIYVNGTFVEENVHTVSFSIYNTSNNAVLINVSTNMTAVNTTHYRSIGLDGIYFPISNWTANVSVMDYTGTIDVASTTIVSDPAIRATLSGSAGGSGTAGGTNPINVATFTIIGKGFPYLGGYLNLTGPGAEAYVNNYNSQKQAFLSNVSSSPAAGDKFQLGGNSSYENPADETITLTAITQSELPDGSMFNVAVTALDIYTGTVYMYITPYVSTAGTWTGTYGFGLFRSSS